MSFDLNRIAGDAQINYLHRPTDAELKEEKTLAGALPPLADFAETGTCLKAKPAYGASFHFGLVDNSLKSHSRAVIVGSTGSIVSVMDYLLRLHGPGP
jgi:hypothetical protein